jgi:hypothetical protein
MTDDSEYTPDEDLELDRAERLLLDYADMEDADLASEEKAAENQFLEDSSESEFDMRDYE